MGQFTIPRGGRERDYLGKCVALDSTVNLHRCQFCEGEGDVVGVEAPLDGVAQVIFHGVQVVEVGVQVRVHENRREEEDGEVQVEVEKENEEVRENRTCATWREHEMTDT